MQSDGTENEFRYMYFGMKPDFLGKMIYLHVHHFDFNFVLRKNIFHCGAAHSQCSRVKIVRSMVRTDLGITLIPLGKEF